MPVRTRVAALVVAAAAAVSCAAWTATTTSAAAALPTVDMGATVKAAQIDPRRADDTLTAGAKSSVLLVEQALRDRNLLAAKWVDGYFGTETVSAYAAYQRSLGYSGLAANGLPGTTSLTKLGSGRYTLTDTVSPGAKVALDGKTVNTRTRDMLAEAEKNLGRGLTLDQGSYNPGGDPTSAGTHDGGGVVDINVDAMSSATKTAVVKALRQVGFAAWSRTPSQGDWPFHIHAAAINDTDLSTQAQHQIGDYYLGKNGLANRAADDGPRITPIRTWEEYQATQATAGTAARAAVAPQAAATQRNGVCESGELCFYFNSNYAGSVSDFTVSYGQYGSSQPSCFEFKGPGNGQGVCLRDNAASVWNRTAQVATVYANDGWDGGGRSQTIASGKKANLNSYLKNHNRSHLIGTGP